MSLSLCPQRLASRNTARDGERLVVDNAAYAWRNNESGVLGQLHPDFVHDYWSQLSEAAIAMLPPLLEQVWAERFAALNTLVAVAKIAGFVPLDAEAPRFGLIWGTDEDVQEHRRHNPNNENYWAVWDEAASRLDVDQLVRNARLDDELPKYAD